MGSFWTGFVLSLSLCLDLGVVNVAIIRTAIGQSGSVAFVLGVGSALGDLLYFTMAVFGAATLVSFRPFRLALWILGTAVLIWMALKMASEVLQPRTLDLSGAASSQMSYATAFTAGIGLAIASPTSILWFATVGGSIIAASAGHGRLWPLAAGFGFAGIAFAAAIAWAIAGLRGIAGPLFVRTVSLASALLFVYFAVRIFLTGAREFLKVFSTVQLGILLR